MRATFVYKFSSSSGHPYSTIPKTIKREATSITYFQIKIQILENLVFFTSLEKTSTVCVYYIRRLTRKKIQIPVITIDIPTEKFTHNECLNQLNFSILYNG